MNSKRRCSGSPNSQSDDADEAFLRDTLDLIEASNPTFLDSLDPLDRQSLMTLSREYRDEMEKMAPDLQRIGEARQAYMRGFQEGLNTVMTGLGEEVLSFAEREALRQDDLMLIDYFSDENTTDARQRTNSSDSAATVCLRESPEAAPRRKEERPAKRSSGKCRSRGTPERPDGANTTHIFWFVPPLVEFEAECRPLAWCLDVPGEDGQRPPDKEDLARSFHGMPLLWRTAEERAIGEDVTAGPDPRLPAH